MASFRYFAEVNGQTVQLLDSSIHFDMLGTKARNFSGLTPDGASKRARR